MVCLYALIDTGIHLELAISSFLISFISYVFITVLVEFDVVAAAVVKNVMLDDIHVHIVVDVATSNSIFSFRTACKPHKKYLQL